MFYCDPCALPRDWPVTIFRSRGTCELCGLRTECSEMPSKKLPVPPAPRNPPQNAGQQQVSE